MHDPEFVKALNDLGLMLLISIFGPFLVVLPMMIRDERARRRRNRLVAEHQRKRRFFGDVGRR